MTAPAEKTFPTTARVVIVGGGVMGCGLAYHLAHEGWTDVVLLEKAELTSGSTWHAAGQITHSTSSFGLGKCVDYNIGLYSGALEAETGHSVTWHGCGSFRLAYTEDEVDWLRHTLSVGRALGKLKTSCSRLTMTGSCHGSKTPWIVCQSSKSSALNAKCTGRSPTHRMATR